MTIETTSQGDLIVVEAPVEMDLEMTELKETLEDFLDSERVKIALDMTKTTFINSVAIGLIVNFIHLYRNKGGDVVLVNPNRGVKKIMTIAGVSKNIKMYDNIEEAKAYFNGI